MKSFLRIAFLVLAASDSGMADDWPNWLGPRNDNRSMEALPAEPGLEKVAWEAEIGIGFSSFAVRDGKVVSLGHRDGEETVWCFAEDSGEVLWKHSYPAGLMPNLHEGGPNATPAIRDKWVYTISKDGQLHCLSMLSGGVTWKKNILFESKMYRPATWGFGGSPLILGERLIIESNSTFAFDRKTGKKIWQSEKYKPAYGSPLHFPSGDRHFLATLKTDGLVILDPANGKTLGFHQWRTSFQTNANTPMLIDGETGKIFISTGYDRGCALFQFDGSDLTKLYENTNLCNHMGNSVLIDGYIYGFDGTAHRGRPVEFACIEALGGTKVWRIPDFKYASITAAQKDLIVLTENGKLLIGKASPEGFQPRVEKQVISGRCWTPPVFANGRIYVRNAQGKVVVLDLE